MTGYIRKPIGKSNMLLKIILGLLGIAPFLIGLEKLIIDKNYIIGSIIFIVGVVMINLPNTIDIEKLKSETHRKTTE